MNRWIALVLVTLPARLLADAALPPNTPPVEVLTMSREGCYGSCPIYRVTVWSDGRVDYEGKDFVQTKGKRSAKLDGAALTRIRDEFATAKYLTLADKYDRYDCTDMPTVVTSFREGATRKSVSHYYGDRHAPRALFALEKAIDEITGVNAWVGARGGPMGFTCH